MINRIDTGWLQVNDALSRQGGRESRKKRARHAADGRPEPEAAARGEDAGTGNRKGDSPSLDVMA